MTTLRLTHDSTTVDCDIVVSEAIKINKAFENIEKLKGSSNYIQTFNLPFTDALASFFGVIYNVNAQNWFDFRKKVNAEVIKDGIPIIRGYIQIKKGTVKESLVDIEVLFIGEVPDLQRNIGEKKLKHLTALPDLDYTLSSANLSDPNANTILTICDKYGFTGAFQGNQYSLQDPVQPTYIGLMTPAVKASWLFEQIVKDAGFEFDPTYIREALEEVYVPFISGKDLGTNSGYETLYFNLGQTTDITGITADNNLTGLTEFADNGNNVASTVFTAPYTGTYTFRYWAKVTRTAGSGNSQIRFVLWNPATSQQYAFSANPMNFASNGSPIYRSESTFINMNAGDTVHLQLQEISGSGTYTVHGDTNNDQQNGTGWQLDAVSNPMLAPSVTVVMSKNAPDMRQVDFYNGIITALRCAIVPDTIMPNKVVIRPMVQYIGSGDTVDYTAKLDTSKAIEMMPTTDMQKRLFTLTYKADGDRANKLYTEGNARTFGWYRITDTLLGEDVNDFATDDETITLPFGATPATYISGTSIITASFLNESGEFVLPTCRLLYKSGTATVNTVSNALAPITANAYTLSNYSEPIPDIDTLDLNFGIETPLHSILAQPYQTLWYRFWARYYRELFSRESRIIEAYFDLNTYDVIDLAFNDKIYIENEMLGNAYWRLLKLVDFDPEGQTTTKLQLIKILDLGLDCDYIPATRAVDGVILFSDGVTSGLDGNQKCCEKYGHVWNATEGKCYRVSTPTRPLNDFSEVLQSAGLSAPRIVYTSTNYEVGVNDTVVNVDSTSGGVDVFLPSVRGFNPSQITVAHHEGTGTVRVYAYNSEKVKDAASINIGSKGNSVTLTKSESGWN